MIKALALRIGGRALQVHRCQARPSPRVPSAAVVTAPAPSLPSQRMPRRDAGIFCGTFCGICFGASPPTFSKHSALPPRFLSLFPSSSSSPLLLSLVWGLFCFRLALLRFAHTGTQSQSLSHRLFLQHSVFFVLKFPAILVAISCFRRFSQRRGGKWTRINLHT